ncbi:MAG: hypothetical protein JNM25_06585 [Planctomycetes bacterium]|nr:hypothetical protein [Planctomycetota bacterium]
MHNLLRRRHCPALLLLGLAACGLSGEGTSGSAGDPGSGGGPGGPGGIGNPLDVVLEFSVTNEQSTARTETVCASVPFPEHGYQSTANLVVSGHQTAWLPLQQWADGSLKIAQAQFTDTLAAGETKTYRVARDEPSLTGAFVRNNWVAQMGAALQVGAEVKDTFSVAYRGFAAGAGTVLQTSPLVQTTRWRTYHLPVSGPGIGRDYLTSTFYATEYRDMPFVVVDWILGNDYLGADVVPPGNTDPNLRALGVADVKDARFLCKGASAVIPYRPQYEAISGQQVTGDGFSSFQVMQDTYIGDAQTRRYRFLLRFEPPGAVPDEATLWRETASAIMERPIYALATQPTWQQTAAAGLLGGPIRGPANANALAAGEYQSWAGANIFGTWGLRGDVAATAATGTPRNQALTPDLAHAIQGQHHRLLQKLEQLAWAQAMRPYHLWNLTVGAEQNILLWGGTPLLLVQGETLGRRGLQDADPYPQYRTLSAGQPWAHGWEPFDHEHFSCDHVFDYWTISGDAWAREELRQLGQSLKGLMRLRTYYTAGVQPARAEGWCMQGFVECYQATRDESLRQYAMRRVNEIVDVGRKKNHPSKAMVFQANYPSTGYPTDNEFFMPWQHGAVLYGYLGAYKAWGEPKLLQIASDVVDTVQYSWVTNVNSSYFGFVANGLRYYVPATFNGTPIPANYWDNLPYGIHWGDNPLGGAHTFLIGGLYHLATMTTDLSVRTRALQYGGLLLGNMSDAQRWNKWNYCLPIQYAPQ